MRIKISGQIIEKVNQNKMNYTHGIYSMLLNNINSKSAEMLHLKNKEMRLFTFTNVFIKDDNIHFYLTGEDSFVNEFIESVVKNQLIRIEDMVIVVASIEPVNELVKKDKYLFKTKVIVNIPGKGEERLLSDMEQVALRLKNNAIRKAEKLGIKGDINFNIINPKRNVEQYKKGHIFSWKCMLEVSGDYDVINAIYNCGAGENTSTGHGFLWEVA
ncbi:MAG: system protein superfamily [Clostridiaceae bacterium]|jgi:CRISPR-associated endoribonuclease Cas6|nr:system protein superfamily [Clostridiaceae bacterium]